MNSIAKKASLTLAGVLTGALLLTACSGSETPEYCDRVDTLQTSIANLTNISVNAGALDDVKTNLETVETDAQAAIDAAREDFPRDTEALESSIDDVRTSINDLPSSPSASEIGVIALQVSAVVNAAESFRDATAAECG